MPLSTSILYPACVRPAQHVVRKITRAYCSHIILALRQTLLNCIDNSGAAVVECIQLIKRKRPAGIGDRIVVVVQKQRDFGSDRSSVSISNKVKRGDIRHAVVVRTRKQRQRPDGSVVKFDDNACVLINKSGEPVGNRLTSIVGAELRDRQWSKILSLAPMHR
ncbi:ribosomal protein L14p/L23e-domain-containing protein [Lineolata rhizophorae]|uniref:Large ribosomal subunit protein uL14m n=1 Tax=Lineolata rhizophorae TaxID=578093 RepID=A0A6A6NXU4_9PEZI|nr:ribosomal protein L14p/L23e-domain-containing protein [Lineolata rhizophorae]